MASHKVSCSGGKKKAEKKSGATKKAAGIHKSVAGRTVTKGKSAQTHAGSPYTTLESRQSTVEKATRQVYGSLERIIAGITPRAEKGDLRAAKFLCDFADVDALSRLNSKLSLGLTTSGVTYRHSAANKASDAKDEEPVPEDLLYAAKQYLAGFDPDAIDDEDGKEQDAAGSCTPVVEHVKNSGE